MKKILSLMLVVAFLGILPMIAGCEPKNDAQTHNEFTSENQAVSQEPIVTP